MSVQAIARKTTVLGSWKEIACYLGKGVRTVQRWERQLGLPVRRPNMAAKGVVCASPEELDQWLAIHWGRRSIAGVPVPCDGTDHKGVRASIQVAHELRDANQRLVLELMRFARGVAEECEALAVNSTLPSKPTEDR